jgi:hypothetical protein
MRYIVPALAVVAGAAAQCGKDGETTTIQNSGDASALSGCSTYKGSIEIASTTTGSISLDGISTIQGDLIANATGVTSISASNLEEIGGEFQLSQMTTLTDLTFPRLVKADSINWVTLPALRGLSFTTGLQEVTTLLISDTQLTSLDGIDLQIASSIMINNNRNLMSINMQLGNITESIDLNSNNKDLAIEFPNLIWANNMTIANCSEFSAPSLEAVNGSIGFYSSTFQNLTAANLTTVGDDLTFVGNNELTNISFPLLTMIGGGFNVANNSALETVDGFPKLESVGGAVNFDGAFTDIELPAVTDVRGAFDVLSSKDLTTTCDNFAKLGDTVQGSYSCEGESPDSSTVGEDGSDPNGSSGSSSTKKGAAASLLIPGSTIVLGLVAAVFGLL